MYCLYCNKRLWTFFSKKRLFCSRQHEVAHQEGLSAINSLIEFVSRPEPPALPAARSQKLSEVDRDGEKALIPMVPDPPRADFVVQRACPKPLPPDPPGAMLLEALPFAGQIRFPSSHLVLVAYTPGSVAKPAASKARKKRAKPPVSRGVRQRSRIPSEPPLTLGDPA